MSENELDRTLRHLFEELSDFRALAETVANPFPGKPDEGANYPDLWKNLGDLARNTLKKWPRP